MNAAHTRHLEGRRLLLIGRLDEAERALAALDPAPFPPASPRAAGRFTVLIAGGTHGADALAVEWAKECGIPIEIHPAEWDRWPKAGPIWNQRMLDQGKPDWSWPSPVAEDLRE